MTKFVFYLLSIMFTQGVLAQTNSIHLDSLFIATRNISSDITPPVSVNDSTYQNQKVFLDLNFYVDNIVTLDSILIKYGNQSGSGDILTMNLKFTIVNGVKGAVYGTKFYALKGNKIFISELISGMTLQHSTFIWIKAKDTSGNYSNLLSKIFN